MLQIYKGNESTDDHIYFNFAKVNNTSVSIPATITLEQLQSIVENPSEYYGSIVRFLVPMGDVPIFTFPEDANYFTVTFAYTDPNTMVEYIIQTPVSFASQSFDVGRNIFSYKHMLDLINQAFITAAGSLTAALLADTITKNIQPPFLVFDATTQLFIIFGQTTVFGNPNTTAPALPGTVLVYFNTNLFQFFSSFEAVENGDVSVNPNASQGRNFQILFHINEGGDIVAVSNPDAIVSTYGQNLLDYSDSKGTHVATITPGLLTLTQLAASVQTQMNVSSTLGGYLCSIDSLTNRIIIRNVANFTLLFGTGVSIANSIASIIGFDALDVGPTMVAVASFAPGSYAAVRTIQEYKTLYAWNSLRTVQFTTTAIPVRKENIPQNLTIQSANEGNPNFSGIMTDFIPNVTEGPESRLYIQYVPQSEYRLFSLLSQQPLRKLDLQIYYTDKFNQQFPVTIPPNESLSLKLMFRRKDFQNKPENNKRKRS